MDRPLTREERQEIAAAIRLEMVSRGITRAMLASLTARAPDNITNLIIGNSVSASGQFDIENVLDRPFWNSVEVFQQLRMDAQNCKSPQRRSRLVRPRRRNRQAPDHHCSRSAA